ncbi:hypothetical protein BGW80DRAFT_1456105 [Lactifluus volemus]|nr:hypothetical protein BGW80DRAFT_1456105 [Lactifluus volemus]
MTSTNTELLDILQAHGQRFLDSFEAYDAEENGKGKRNPAEAHRSINTKLARIESDHSSSVYDSHSAEEWTGFGSDVHMDDEYEAHSSSEEMLPLEANTSVPKPDVVVFTASVSKSSELVSTKAQAKSFMSSKVSKLKDEVQRRKDKKHSDDEDDELTNTQNDALLHRLVHTQLLSGSLNQELNLTSAQRKKALEGRILELAGTSKLGQGEKTVRAKERNKASKRVREGMLEKQKQRREKLVQEAKDMGNYHPAFTKLFQDPLEKNAKHNRERGLRMGVGSYMGGALRLSKKEIDSVQAGQTSIRTSGRRRNKR